MTYIIKDWANNIMFNGKTFDSYEEGWEFIYANVDNSIYDTSQDDNDNEYQEYYVVPF